MNPGTPPAEHDIDEELVGDLLREQHADLAEESIHLVDEGWDNAMFRLGEHLAVRLPRRERAVALMEHEQRWLPELAQSLPLPVPSPVRLGVPGCGYPWPWSVVPWLPGSTADVEAPDASQAVPLAEFLRALHQPAPADAPENPLRGVLLHTQDGPMEGRLERLREVEDIDTEKLRDIWMRALEVPEAREARWLHGDLHGRNVLVSAGALTGVIDWGDLTAGDTATDLAAVWMLLREPSARAACLAHYRADPDLIVRAQGWAVFLGTVLLATGLVDHPRHAAMGRETLRRVCEDS